MSQWEPATAAWRSSSRCDSTACVEVAPRGQGVAVRDNTLPGSHLAFDGRSWHGLLHDLRSGRLHR